MDASLRSRVVVYVTIGQLYRKEVEFLRTLQTQSLPVSRCVIMLLNMEDLKSKSMPKAVQQQELEALATQVNFLPRPQIVIGAAAPTDGSQPHLDQFCNLLQHAMALGA